MTYRTDALRRGPGLLGGLLGFAAATALALAVSDVSYAVARAVYSGIAAANSTNYTYYVHLIRHGRSWNSCRASVGAPALPGDSLFESGTGG